MLDANLMLIDSTADVEATVTGTGKLIGQSLVPETWQIHLPSTPTGTTPTCTVTIEESDALGSGYVAVATRAVTAAGDYYETVMCNKVYRRAVLTVGGTTPNFGKIEVGRVPAGRDKNW